MPPLAFDVLLYVRRDVMLDLILMLFAFSGVPKVGGSLAAMCSWFA